MTKPTGRVATAAAAVAAFLGALLLPGPAQAAEIYKYWGYFSVDDGGFVSQSEGPGGTNPGDGAIEAYRYAAPADFENPNLPRADLETVTFDSVCTDTAAEAGQKRVAVLVDFGVESDAEQGETPPQPQAACAVVPEDATGLQTLQAAFPEVRTEKSSFGPAVCAIQGYPATGCLGTLAETGTPADGEPVDFAMPSEAETAPTSSDSTDDAGNEALLLGGAAVVLAGIVLAGVLLRRRRPTA